MTDRLITYEQMAGYFDPPLSQKTIYNWLRAARLKVFRTPGANPFKGNKTIRVRRSQWEKLLRQNERPIRAKKEKASRR